MPTSDALVVVNDWISEFYFTADETSGTFLAATKNLVKQWREDAEDSPQEQSPLERFTSARQSLVSQLIDLHARAAELDTSATDRQRREALTRPSAAVAERLRTVLGFDAVPQRGDGALRRCSAVDMDEPTVALISAVAAETPEELLTKNRGLLTEDVVLHPEDDAGAGDPISSVAELLSALVSEEQPPRYMLVLAGRTAVLTSEDAWPQGRYLAIDLQTVAERGDARSGGEIQRALACLSASSLAPDPTGTIWWDARREESVRNAVGVSKDLRDGVRESIEIIANEVVARRKTQGLPPLPDDQAQPLAVQSLRYLYRILFLLYAEASPELGVVPTGDPEYAAGYSVDRLRELTLKPLTSRLGGRHALLRVPSGALRPGGDRPPARGSWAGAGRRSRARGPGLRAAALGPLPPEPHAVRQRGEARQQGPPAGAAAPAADQGAPRPGPRLHQLCGAGHQPARRGLRVPDELHRFLRHRHAGRGRPAR